MARKTPQEKKRQSYLRDRRNTYGENAKSSRKNIARNKRLESRAERHAARQAVAADARDPDTAAEAQARVEGRRKRWSKVADQPLGEVVQRKLRARVRLGVDAPAGAAAKVERIRRRTGRGG